MTRALSILSIAVLLTISAPSVYAVEWKTYVNERFGFSFGYAASLKPGRMPTNEAGRNFTDGTFSVTAQGHFLQGKTIDDYYREALSRNHAVGGEK